MTVSESFRDKQTHTHTHAFTLAEKHALVYPMTIIAEALDWPCCLLHSYGFMLHHRGISFSVDYNSQKPLIKPCTAKAFCFFAFFSPHNYLSRNESEAPSDLLTKSPLCSGEPQQAKHPINCSTSAKQFALTEVCLWGAFSPRLVFWLNRLACLITARGGRIFTRACWLWWLSLVFR